MKTVLLITQNNFFDMLGGYAGMYTLLLHSLFPACTEKRAAFADYRHRKA